MTDRSGSRLKKLRQRSGLPFHNSAHVTIRCRMRRMIRRTIGDATSGQPSRRQAAGGPAGAVAAARAVRKLPPVRGRCAVLWRERSRQARMAR